MNKINTNGVCVVHNGMYLYTVSSNGTCNPIEKLKIHDSNGNEFYSNYNSKEEAAEAIIKLAEKGKNAIIGPKAPWIDYITGKPIPNKDENAVGVYIVEEKEQIKTK